MLRFIRYKYFTIQTPKLISAFHFLFCNFKLLLKLNNSISFQLIQLKIQVSKADCSNQSSSKMLSVSLRLSIITMFPLPNFQFFFTTLSLSHLHINYLFKLYNVISTNAYSIYDYPIIYSKKFSSILIFINIFQSSFSFHHFEKISIVFV